MAQSGAAKLFRKAAGCVSGGLSTANLIKQKPREAAGGAERWR